MTRKIFLICLALLLVMQGVVSAKDEGLPEEDRIKIAVEVKDGSRHKELGTAQSLELFLNDKLVEKNLITVVDTNTSDAEQTPAQTVVEQNYIAENIGEILIFDAIELPRASTVAKDFEPAFYKNFGVDYVVRCEVLALGATKVEDKAIGLITGIVGGGLSLGGSGSSNRDKTLRRVGAGVGLLGFGSLLDVTKRTALNTVVNMQFINVETGEVVWENNFTGKAIKHHSPGKGYDDVWTQAYMESVEDSAKLIAKRVNKYVDKVIVKGKSDKDFMPKGIPFSKGLF
ncbi:MAG: hypothetical protein IJG33_11230 [Selenomonadaceae bacterium]|nr:hypothetical protein [Selenomonadaceae bacterium]